MNSRLYESFLQLVRIGIGTAKGVAIPKDTVWEELKALADAQGLSAVVLDGLNAVHDSGFMVNGSSLPLEMKLEWIGEVLQNYELRYVQYEKAISALAGFYNQHGFKMMLLKGYACSLDWPKSNHRPCGDMDIWLFGEQKAADAAIAKEKGINIDDGHHHHTVFNWQGLTVENHYDFVNVYAHKTGKEQEAIFKELGNITNVNDNDNENDNSGSNTNGTNITNVLVNGEKVYLPSPNLHALFLVRHLANHFASMEITLRQVLDWAFFVEKHTKDIDWKWLVDLLEKYHLKDFYNCINAICVGDLGFNVKMFPNVQFDPNLKEKILKDILNPEFGSLLPKGFANRLVYKYRRWKANAWKQQLCYGENRSTEFWTSVKAHLLKPSSI